MIDAVSKLSLAVLGLAVIFVWFLGSPASDTAQMHQGTIAMTGLHWTSNLIAGPLVRQLLSKGYSVRGVVPNLNDPEAMAQAHKMFPKVEWYEADLLQEGSLQPILDGCQHVVHMAQVAPELEGDVAANLLSSAAQSSSRMRVILTSSAVSNGVPGPPVWELEGTALASRLQQQHPHHKLELVALQHGLVLAPPLSNASDSPSVAAVKRFLEGEYHSDGVPHSCHAVIDVRDVVTAHISALQSPEAAGRGVLLSSSQAYTQLELAQMLALDFADWPLPVKAQGLPEPCPAVNTAGSEQLLKLQLSPISSAVVDMAKGIVKVGIAKRPEWYVPPVNALLFAALYKAFNKALGGGFAGAVAMIIQVFTLMWLRTTMNYQYKHGHTTQEAIAILYKEGGVGRFYQGILPALFQGPLSRFFDTAANNGVLTLMDALPQTRHMPLVLKTVAASAAASISRILLMPVDALKTSQQVEGKKGFSMLCKKVSTDGVSMLFAGATAQLIAGFVGHYPWYYTFNLLHAVLPPGASFSQKTIRNALIGMVATITSDVPSNGLRVVKTEVQTSSKPTTYRKVVLGIYQEEGAKGFFRGLQTRMLVNILQGALFSVMWRILVELISGK
jgi:nucleoside-diphosphate-sugar epimerase|eukprot:CAMPEP_0174307446 /NCGR_PEP_ID=MMETSP0810-20121108/1127_1 /TAXON_ID=73025 ORGANISM="Eutreptiella gymnastica-like, Strain CCMP1594" /NCGR_SAMPLE_ID=MMETSP0810 /ASSEMBLY_ACC=CAM_ASM_000659 /LENGTH=614 /DNA_ID=CAMNT_0015414505 /DNA_START=49 /DNA_END=1893 /DNA_ORIENTATION=-